MAESRLDLFSEIPLELWQNIKSSLSLRDLINLSMVNKAWRKAVSIDLARARLLDFSIVQIEKTNKGLLFLDNKGTVWRHESDSYNSFSINNHQTKTVPVPIPGLSKIKKIFVSAMQDSFFFLNEEGKVWACGNNNNGQLGVNYYDNNLSNPEAVHHLIKINEIISVGGSTWFLDVSGAIWLSGTGPDHQLSSPEKMTLLPKINHMAIQFGKTKSKIYALDNEKNVWLLHRNGADRISTLTNIKKILTNFYNEAFFQNEDRELLFEVPRLGLDRIKVKDIVEDKWGKKVFLIDLDSKVWVIGDNTFNRLGLGTKILFRDRCYGIICDVPPIQQVLPCYKNILLIDNESYVWVAGSNEDNVFGFADIEIIEKPIKILGLPPIKCVVNNRDSYFFVDFEDRLWVSGKWAHDYLCKDFLTEEGFTIGYKPTLIPNYYVSTIKQINDSILLIDKLGNAKILLGKYSHTLHLMVDSFNFLLGYQLKILQECSFSLDELNEFAYSSLYSNEVFYYAMLNKLETLDRPTRLHYLINLYEASNKDAECFANLLFINIEDDFSDVSIILDDGEIKKRNVAKNMLLLYDYFADIHKPNITAISSDQSKRYNDFVTLLLKINNNEIKDVTELNNYILDNKKNFEAHSTRLFGAIPSFSKTYSDLRNNLVNILQADSYLFEHLQKVVKVFIFAYLEFIKTNQLLCGLIKEIPEFDSSNVMCMYNKQGDQDAKSFRL